MPMHVRCSDVICDFPLKDMLAYHKQKGAEGTILVTKVTVPALLGSHECLRGLSSVTCHSKAGMIYSHCCGLCCVQHSMWMTGRSS